MLIGEVARRSGVSARMLRHYEELGLVTPTGRTAGGYRDYSGADIRRIFLVESLRSLGLSLREAGRALDDPGFRPAGLVEELIGRTRERIARETELLTRLSRIGSAEPEDWADVLRTVALLHDLGSDSAGRRQRAALASPADQVPVEALVEAVLSEPDPVVGGTLRWALARSAGAVPPLAEALGSPSAVVRERAVRALAELSGDDATAVLGEALAHEDVTVRRQAALASAVRGGEGAVPILLDMIVAEVSDADAADALGVLAADAAVGERIVAALAGRLAGEAAPARRRLTQALADVPGETASRALEVLAGDEDRVVALTASSVLALRR